MLNKDKFFNGIEKLKLEFGEKGFKMTKDKALQWFEYMKGMSEDEFDERIDYVLKNCSFPPSMADIFRVEIKTRTMEELL